MPLTTEKNASFLLFLILVLLLFSDTGILAKSCETMGVALDTIKFVTNSVNETLQALRTAVDATSKLNNLQR